MSARDPVKQRQVNALYYQRLKMDPEKMRKRRAQERRWRALNHEHVREREAGSYERNRAHYLWIERLWRMLLSIRRAAIRRGEIPYDG